MGTEMENAKWMSSRKRGMDDAAQFEKATAAGNKRSAPNHKVFRFHSRRGCSNTMAFLDMDHLPDILSQRPTSSGSVDPGSSASGQGRLVGTAPETVASAATCSRRAQCVITGKIALYRDPKTLLGYHDIASYNEIQRRLETGELTIAKSEHDNDRESTSSRPSNRERDPRSSSNQGTTMVRPKTFLPFVAESIMVAKINSNGSHLKVMATQGGVPVSPPNTRIRLKLSGTQPPSLAEGSQNHDHGNVTVDSDSPTINDIPHQQPVHYQSPQPIEQTQVLVEAAGTIGSSNRTEVAVSQHTVSSGASKTVATTLLRTNGEGAKFKSPPILVVSKSTGDGNKDDCVPDTATS